ncbi:hypothetical protein M413DRAFT_446790 [Hebeloma cylindrosporum]|uniref:Uncharacterized protein n=1 Tax=Hebeloma cylindrosporum TaxID=76867 RepID=A0A0C2XQG2_HEBCY|nr:hypothetical protein M413DRAFT_446790 [Hebeloma cylindrosporum h7]
MILCQIQSIQVKDKESFEIWMVYQAKLVSALLRIENQKTTESCSTCLFKNLIARIGSSEATDSGESIA